MPEVKTNKQKQQHQFCAGGFYTRLFQSGTSVGKTVQRVSGWRKGQRAGNRWRLKGIQGGGERNFWEQEYITHRELIPMEKVVPSGEKNSDRLKRRRNVRHWQEESRQTKAFCRLTGCESEREPPKGVFLILIWAHRFWARPLSPDPLFLTHTFRRAFKWQAVL